MVRIVAGEMELVGERGDKKAKGGSKKKTKKNKLVGRGSGSRSGKRRSRRKEHVMLSASCRRSAFD